MKFLWNIKSECPYNVITIESELTKEDIEDCKNRFISLEEIMRKRMSTDLEKKIDIDPVFGEIERIEERIEKEIEKDRRLRDLIRLSRYDGLSEEDKEIIKRIRDRLLKKEDTE